MDVKGNNPVDIYVMICGNVPVELPSSFGCTFGHLCEKLARAGLSGVHGEAGASALDRRRRVVEHAIELGLVTRDDLALLTPDDL